MRLVDIKHPWKTKTTNCIMTFCIYKILQLPTLYPLLKVKVPQSFAECVLHFPLVFLTLIDKLVFGFRLWHTLLGSFIFFAGQSHLVFDNSASCVTFERFITASMYSHLLRGVAQRGSGNEGLGCRSQHYLQKSKLLCAWLTIQVIRQ